MAEAGNPNFVKSQELISRMEAHGSAYGPPASRTRNAAALADLRICAEQGGDEESFRALRDAFYRGAIAEACNVTIDEANRRIALGSAKNAKLTAKMRRDDDTEAAYNRAKFNWSFIRERAGLPKLSVGGNRGAGASERFAAVAQSMIDADQNAAVRAFVGAGYWELIVQAMMDADEQTAIQAVGQVLLNNKDRAVFACGTILLDKLISKVEADLAAREPLPDGSS